MGYTFRREKYKYMAYDATKFQPEGWGSGGVKPIDREREPLDIDHSQPRILSGKTVFRHRDGTTAKVVVKGIKLTRAEIAKRTGLCETFISRIFGGARGVSVETLKRLCLAFGPEGFVTLDEMYMILASLKRTSK